MEDRELRNRERRVRRELGRQGIQIHKSRTGGEHFDLDLEALERRAEEDKFHYFNGRR